MSFTSWDVFQKNSRKSSCISTPDMENNKFLRLAKKILWLFFAFFWMIQTASGETILQTSRGGVTFQIKTIAKGLGVPWGMVFISPDQILFTERNGKIGILAPASGKIIRI
ncbi:MAG TPA: PQQ-dependent sugar dehydrogenase, partial [Candidatus Lambdaproteobacteria bacterium]|nr:PQQ-dependent sugar dehydrogenase [Candidatus Lambdaproteobacteria bacterium]